jgi:hypothetical protein
VQPTKRGLGVSATGDAVRCVTVNTTGSRLGAVGLVSWLVVDAGAGMIGVGGADNVVAAAQMVLALYDVDVARDGACRC